MGGWRRGRLYWLLPKWRHLSRAGEKLLCLDFFKVRSHLARLPEPDLGGGGAGRQGGGGLGAETTGGSAASDCADGC